MTTTNHLVVLHKLWRIRALEEKIHQLRIAGDIVGSVHLCNGQEAVAVGACAALQGDDPVFSTYRGHGWALARGVPGYRILAELLGRRTGANGGRGGSAYFSAPEYRFYGENSIVGAGAPIGAGAGLAARFDGSGRVAVTVFGDGAMNQGGVHEAMNFAAAMKLPVIFICENNRYSELTPYVDMVANPRITDRATALGIPAVEVDGNDASAVKATVQLARAQASVGSGPTFIEAHTQRIVGHYIGDAEHYRPAGESARDALVEPIAALTQRLTARGTPADQIALAESTARAEMDAAAARALADPLANPSTVMEHLYA